MFPPIFALCAASKSVTDLLGLKPTRLYPFGQAGSDTKKPYAVWQTIGGEPENYLDQLPDIDYLDIQINVYADSASKAREVVKAICNAIELNAQVTRWGGEDRDPETKDYIYTFDVEFITDRDF